MADLQLYMPYIVLALTGLIAGWLSGLLLGGGGLLRNLVVGVIGAFVGNYLVSSGLLHLPESLTASVAHIPYGAQILIATIGAILVVILARIVSR